MLALVAGSKESGRPRSTETMFRDHAWPHCGWSSAEAGTAARREISKARKTAAWNAAGVRSGMAPILHGREAGDRRLRYVGRYGTVFKCNRRDAEDAENAQRQSPVLSSLRLSLRLCVSAVASQPAVVTARSQ